MTALSFIDTNILVYAFADTGDDRHAAAHSLVDELLDSQNAGLSVQLLREFYTVATWKVKRTFSHSQAAATIEDLSIACRVVDDTLPQLNRALELAGGTAFRSGTHPSQLPPKLRDAKSS
ncbi:MAG: PIN domain-containing protein [Acidobacteria bacterium]|nr:PIN domain-containing protein [Acidobacteriota bacterium]